MQPGILIAHGQQRLGDRSPHTAWRRMFKQNRNHTAFLRRIKTDRCLRLSRSEYHSHLAAFHLWELFDFRNTD